MTLLEEARAVLVAAREDPRPALERAQELLERATTDEVCATLHFAIGMAHRTLANGTESTEHLETAARRAGGQDTLRGQILRSLAFNYAQAGDNKRGDRTVRESISLLSGQERDLSRLQQAFMLQMRGEHQAALPFLSAATDSFAESGDDEYLELTLYNRASVHMESGDYDASITDLERAYEIGLRLDHKVSAADAALHLSQVMGWRDDVPGAMTWHNRSVELRTAAGATNPLADTEHAFVLIQARLMREAEETLLTSLPRLVAAGGNHAIAVAGRLLLADVLLDRGDHSGALAQIDQAALESPPDGRWRFDIAAAHHRARAVAGESSKDLVESMLVTAREMEQNGEHHAAAVERCRAVTVAVAGDDLETAQQLTDSIRRTAASGPLWLQIQAWSSLAQLRYAAGNLRGAAAAVSAGIRRLDEYRSGIGATDLRLHAAELGDSLREVGIQLAIESGAAEKVLHMTEQLRSTAAAPAATTPAIESALVDLRRAVTRQRTADPEEAEETEQRVRAAEKAVSALTRQARRETSASTGFSVDDIRGHLAGRTLVAFVHSGPSIYAVVVTDTASRLVALGTLEDTQDLVDHLRFAAERIARPSTSASSRRAAITSAESIADSLRRKLIDPCAAAGSRLVVIPSRGLHGVPWGLVCKRPIETAPSAAEWIAARRRTIRQGSALVVHGPDLEHAAAEVGAISEATGASVARTVGETIRHLGNASSAHFACHTRPRVDSPMFSSLMLDDGDLTLHDIERLGTVPSTIVLATCAAGSTVLASGEEIVSVAGAFLAMGAKTVVAPLFTVSDETTYRMMELFHASVAAGNDPATVLNELRESDNQDVAFTAGSFSCFGSC